MVEVQLARDDDKAYVWPAYVCNLRSRIRSPVCLLVMTADETVARWASQAIQLGGDNQFRPWVLSPTRIPEITDEEQARKDPELAVLSAMAHGRNVDVEKATQIALAAEAALLGLDAERANLYHDMLDQALSEAARRALQTMVSGKYEYRGEFAKRYYGQGLTEGRAQLVLRQLTMRFGALPESVRARLQSTTSEELDQIGERLLTASTLSEALGAQ